MSELTVVERRIWRVRGADWDAFAARHDASIRSSLAYLRAWAAKRALRSRVRLFEIYDGDPRALRKVGQCAVAVTGGEYVFLDRLLIDEKARPWGDAMTAVLRALGPGRVRYGWELSMEDSREQDFAEIPGVAVTGVRPLFVDAVDFSSWPDWEQYWRAISNNTRRNVKKAQTEIPGLGLDVRTGLRSLGHVRTIIRLRAAMYRRKGLPFRQLPAAVSVIAGILTSPRHTMTAVVTSTEARLAAFHGQVFARNTYYTDGGSDAGISGAAWFLITEMARRAYEGDPEGRFVMGYLDPALHDESVGGGLVRSRRSMRVTSYPTAIVTLTSAPRR